jgi:hypothetical protein
MMQQSRLFIILFASIILAGCALPASGSSSRVNVNYGQEIRVAAAPYALDLARWEIDNLLRPESLAIDNNIMPGLQDQITQVLRDNEITALPPVRFRLENPPYLLVVSPRYRIVYLDRIMLRANLTASDIGQAERQVDVLGFSSLVVKLGGLGAAYPAIVSPDMQQQQIINAVVEEWAHQYLALRPLGFLYLLDSIGIRQDPDAIVMNETLAGMIADEIGTQVYEIYYKINVAPGTQHSEKGIDFAAEMRQTRRTVDGYLADGKIAEAEQYMEERRIFFNQNGYAIRKLNQAYFAFHGIYGQDPGSVSPVYEDMKTLRAGYTNLAEFIIDVSAMTKYTDLQKALSGELH